MAKVAPTDSPTVVDPPSVPSTNNPSLPTKSDFSTSDHHSHPSYPLLPNSSPVYQSPPHESTRDPTLPSNSQPDLPPRDDPSSADPPQPQSPHTPDTHPTVDSKDHHAHHHLPPTTPDPDLQRHSLPIPQPQNGQPIMGVIASFNDLTLAPQLPYAPPPPMHMLPIQPQPVLPLVPPQHHSHITPHQPHPRHHPSNHKHHHQTHLLPSTYDLWVPQDRVGAVIGGHGAVIRSLQEQSGATIQVHNDTVRGDLKLFTISGTLAQYDIAKQLINEIVEKPRSIHSSGHGPHSSSDRPPFSPAGDHVARVGEVWKTVYVPTTCVGLVIGRNGETIRNLQDRSGAEIKVTPDEEAAPDSESRSILICGTEDAISTAHQLISEIVMDAPSRRPPQTGPPVGTSVNGQPVVLEVLTIPNEKVGLIIGKRGAAIRELQSKSGAKIQVTKDDREIQSDGSRPVTITGIRQHVDEAKAMIANKINMPLMPSPSLNPAFNNASQPGAAANLPPVTGPTHQPPYMMPHVYDPTFQNGQQPFQQMYDPNDPAAQNRTMAYFQYIGYNNYALAQQRQFQNQISLPYGHPSQQVHQEPAQPGLQTTHQEGQDAIGQQSQFAAQTMQQGQPVEAVQSSPGVVSRDPNGNVVVYPPHYTPPPAHIGAHQLYNSGPPNPRVFSRREHVHAAHHHAHAQMMMQAQAAHAQAHHVHQAQAHAQAHAHAVHAHVQAQANAHAEAEAEAEAQARQQRPQTPILSVTTEDNEQPNG